MPCFVSMCRRHQTCHLTRTPSWYKRNSPGANEVQRATSPNGSVATMTLGLAQSACSW